MCIESDEPDARDAKGVRFHSRLRINPQTSAPSNGSFEHPSRDAICQNCLHIAPWRRKFRNTGRDRSTGDDLLLLTVREDNSAKAGMRDGDLDGQERVMHRGRDPLLAAIQQIDDGDSDGKFVIVYALLSKKIEYLTKNPFYGVRNVRFFSAHKTNNLMVRGNLLRKSPARRRSGALFVVKQRTHKRWHLSTLDIFLKILQR